MMQQAVLKSYFDVFGKRPLRKIAADTGITTSRIFRILNGHEMKVSEYERFQKCIAGNEPKGKEVFDSLRDSEALLTSSMKEEVQDFIERLVTKRKINLSRVAL